MMNLLRAILPIAVKQSIKKVMGMPSARVHLDWKILESLPRQHHPHTVFDLGARNGWFIKCWQDWCKDSEVHAFEPDLVAYNRLLETYRSDQSVSINAQGVGDTSTTKTFYHLGASEVSSSFLAPDQATWNDIKYQTGDITESSVDLTTLDDYCRGNDIASVFLIKIDIQGYELKALQGAISTLKNTDYILVESSVRPLYEGAPRFTDVFDFLSENGFHLIDFRAWHRGNKVLMETDMLFRSNELAPEVSAEPGVDRYYIGHK